MFGDSEATPVEINAPSSREAKKRRWKQQKTSITTRMKLVSTWEAVTMEGKAKKRHPKKADDERLKFPPIQTTNRFLTVDYQPSPLVRSQPKQPTLMEQIKERYSDTRRASLLIYSQRDSLRESLFAFRRSWPTQDGYTRPEVIVENPKPVGSKKPVLGEIKRSHRTEAEQSRRDSRIPDPEGSDEDDISQPTKRRVSFATELPHVEPVRTHQFDLGRRRSIRLPDITEKQNSDSVSVKITAADDDDPIGISFQCSDEFRTVFNEMFGQMSVE